MHARVVSDSHTDEFLGQDKSITHSAANATCSAAAYFAGTSISSTPNARHPVMAAACKTTWPMPEPRSKKVSAEVIFCVLMMCCTSEAFVSPYTSREKGLYLFSWRGFVTATSYAASRTCVTSAGGHGAVDKGARQDAAEASLNRVQSSERARCADLPLCSPPLLLACSQPASHSRTTRASAADTPRAAPRLSAFCCRSFIWSTVASHDSEIHILPSGICSEKLADALPSSGASKPSFLFGDGRDDSRGFALRGVLGGVLAGLRDFPLEAAMAERQLACARAQVCCCPAGRSSLVLGTLALYQVSATIGFGSEDFARTSRSRARGRLSRRRGEFCNFRNLGYSTQYTVGIPS